MDKELQPFHFIDINNIKTESAPYDEPKDDPLSIPYDEIIPTGYKQEFMTKDVKEENNVDHEIERNVDGYESQSSSDMEEYVVFTSVKMDIKSTAGVTSIVDALRIVSNNAKSISDNNNADVNEEDVYLTSDGHMQYCEKGNNSLNEESTSDVETKASELKDNSVNDNGRNYSSLYNVRRDDVLRNNTTIHAKKQGIYSKELRENTPNLLININQKLTSLSKNAENSKNDADNVTMIPCVVHSSNNNATADKNSYSSSVLAKSNLQIRSEDFMKSTGTCREERNPSSSIKSYLSKVSASVTITPVYTLPHHVREETDNKRSYQAVPSLEQKLRPSNLAHHATNAKGCFRDKINIHNRTNKPTQLNFKSGHKIPKTISKTTRAKSNDESSQAYKKTSAHTKQSNKRTPSPVGCKKHKNTSVSRYYSQSVTGKNNNDKTMNERFPKVLVKKGIISMESEKYFDASPPYLCLSKHQGQMSSSTDEVTDSDFHSQTHSSKLYKLSHISSHEKHFSPYLNTVRYNHDSTLGANNLGTVSQHIRRTTVPQTNFQLFNADIVSKLSTDISNRGYFKNSDSKKKVKTCFKDPMVNVLKNWSSSNFAPPTNSSYLSNSELVKNVGTSKISAIEINATGKNMKDSSININNTPSRFPKRLGNNDQKIKYAKTLLCSTSQNGSSIDLANIKSVQNIHTSEHRSAKTNQLTSCLPRSNPNQNEDTTGNISLESSSLIKSYPVPCLDIPTSLQKVSSNDFDSTQEQNNKIIYSITSPSHQESASMRVNYDVITKCILGTSITPKSRSVSSTSNQLPYSILRNDDFESNTEESRSTFSQNNEAMPSSLVVIVAENSIADANITPNNTNINSSNSQSVPTPDLVSKKQRDSCAGINSFTVHPSINDALTLNTTHKESSLNIIHEKHHPILRNSTYQLPSEEMSNFQYPVNSYNDRCYLGKFAEIPIYQSMLNNPNALNQQGCNINYNQNLNYFGVGHSSLYNPCQMNYNYVNHHVDDSNSNSISYNNKVSTNNFQQPYNQFIVTPTNNNHSKQSSQDKVALGYKDLNKDMCSSSSNLVNSYPLDTFNGLLNNHFYQDHQGAEIHGQSLYSHDPYTQLLYSSNTSNKQSPFTSESFQPNYSESNGRIKGNSESIYNIPELNKIDPLNNFNQPQKYLSNQRFRVTTTSNNIITHQSFIKENAPVMNLSNDAINLHNINLLTNDKAVISEDSVCLAQSTSPDFINLNTSTEIKQSSTTHTVRGSEVLNNLFSYQNNDNLKCDTINSDQTTIKYLPVHANLKTLSAVAQQPKDTTCLDFTSNNISLYTNSVGHIKNSESVDKDIKCPKKPKKTFQKNDNLSAVSDSVMNILPSNDAPPIITNTTQFVIVRNTISKYNVNTSEPCIDNEINPKHMDILKNNHPLPLNDIQNSVEHPTTKNIIELKFENKNVSEHFKSKDHLQDDSTDTTIATGNHSSFDQNLVSKGHLIVTSNVFQGHIENLKGSSSLCSNDPQNGAKHINNGEAGTKYPAIDSNIPQIKGDTNKKRAYKTNISETTLKNSLGSTSFETTTKKNTYVLMENELVPQNIVGSTNDHQTNLQFTTEENLAVNQTSVPLTSEQSDLDVLADFVYTHGASSFRPFFADMDKSPLKQSSFSMKDQSSILESDLGFQNIRHSKFKPLANVSTTSNQLPNIDKSKNKKLNQSNSIITNNIPLKHPTEKNHLGHNLLDVDSKNEIQSSMQIILPKEFSTMSNCEVFDKATEHSALALLADLTDNSDISTCPVMMNIEKGKTIKKSLIGLKKGPQVLLNDGSSNNNHNNTSAIELLADLTETKVTSTVIDPKYDDLVDQIPLINGSNLGPNQNISDVTYISKTCSKHGIIKSKEMFAPSSHRNIKNPIIKCDDIANISDMINNDHAMPNIKVKNKSKNCSQERRAIKSQNPLKNHNVESTKKEVRNHYHEEPVCVSLKDNINYKSMRLYIKEVTHSKGNRRTETSPKNKLRSACNTEENSISSPSSYDYSSTKSKTTHHQVTNTTTKSSNKSTKPHKEGENNDHTKHKDFSNTSCVYEENILDPNNKTGIPKHHSNPKEIEVKKTNSTIKINKTNENKPDKNIPLKNNESYKILFDIKLANTMKGQKDFKKDSNLNKYKRIKNTKINHHTSRDEHDQKETRKMHKLNVFNQSRHNIAQSFKSNTCKSSSEKLNSKKDAKLGTLSNKKDEVLRIPRHSTHCKSVRLGEKIKLSNHNIHKHAINSLPDKKTSNRKKGIKYQESTKSDSQVHDKSNTTFYQSTTNICNQRTKQLRLTKSDSDSLHSKEFNSSSRNKKVSRSSTLIQSPKISKKYHNKFSDTSKLDDSQKNKTPELSKTDKIKQETNLINEIPKRIMNEESKFKQKKQKTTPLPGNTNESKTKIANLIKVDKFTKPVTSKSEERELNVTSLSSSMRKTKASEKLSTMSKSCKCSNSITSRLPKGELLKRDKKELNKLTGTASGEISIKGQQLLVKGVSLNRPMTISNGSIDELSSSSLKRRFYGAPDKLNSLKKKKCTPWFDKN